MRNDFTPDNVELWISNWKRKDLINGFTREWLDSFDFERVNIITNHSSVTIDDFDSDVRPKVKIWNNVMRHDSAIGPLNENYNQAYVHTFLSGKKYCICAHDNMHIKAGWDQIIRETDYDLYIAPQGDQVHLITLDGLRQFGWWDERYTTNGNHEIDYLVRAYRTAIHSGARASIVDLHHMWPHSTESSTLPGLTHNKVLSYNSVGLEHHWVRANKNDVTQVGSRGHLLNKVYGWNDVKWRSDGSYPFANPASLDNIMAGPLVDEIDWYPWLDINTVTFAPCDIK